MKVLERRVALLKQATQRPNYRSDVSVPVEMIEVKNLVNKMKSTVNEMKQQKAKKKKAKNPVASGFKVLSDAASVFALACTDPWNQLCNNVSMPTMSAGASYKCRVIKRLIVTSGASGYGFVAFAPALANDVNSLIYSSASTWTGSAVTTTTAAGLSLAALDKLPFASASLTDLTATNGVAGRIISYGIKINYIGTEVDKGGVYYTYVSSSRESVNGYTADTLGALVQTALRPIDRREMNAVVTPTNRHESDYSNEDQTDTDLILYPYSNSAAYTAGTSIPAIGCILIQSKTGNTFEVQVVQHVEYIGKGAQPFLTETRSDVVGFEEVISAVGNLNAYPATGDPNIKPARLLRQMLLRRKIALSPRVEATIRNSAYAMRVGGGLVANTMVGARSFLG